MYIDTNVLSCGEDSDNAYMYNNDFETKLT